jgi:3D-(3,5/4)-trihydroxycyclohexane-1,2-dione acylhydrolase (decyclizing)
MLALRIRQHGCRVDIVSDFRDARLERVRLIAEAGGLRSAIDSGVLPRRIDITTAEATVLGLLLQDVRTYVTVFGHGSTDLAEVLRVYASVDLVKVIGVRHETEAAHAATALRWVTGKKAAVVTSIGPGALHAMAGSLVSATDGIGVWHIYGDETTEDEGLNMQQIPRHEQGLYLKFLSILGDAYSVHTPAALPTALRRGLNVVDHPHRAGPFFLLLPLNTQPAVIAGFNLRELPSGTPPPLGAAADDGSYDRAVAVLRGAQRVVVRLGGGAVGASDNLDAFLELIDGVAVVSPIATGVLPSDHPRNMTVGGSKGSISGNFAMEEADTLVMIGSRSVCQSDCSRTGYPGVQNVININTDVQDATHYANTIALLGDADATLEKLITHLQQSPPTVADPSSWFAACTEQRNKWEEHKRLRYENPLLHDPMWGREVLTQPAAVKLVTDWARSREAVTFFDAGDVQANGLQIVEDDRPGQTITDTGASYMGFASSALLATGLADEPFYGVALTGDGSFTMNPQILIDGAAAAAQGCIVLLDNRRMAAISSLQQAQYGADFATADGIEVDYVKWAQSVAGVAAFHGGYTPDELLNSLDRATSHPGLSLVHVPVYYGSDPMGGLGEYGRWNVGPNVAETQALRHEIGL